MDTNCVEALLRARSVDFVTYAGAGGQVEAMESAQNRDNDVDLVSGAELRARRPDLIELIESSARKETTNVKTLEQQLAETQAQLAEEKKARTAAETKATAAEAKIPESEKASKKATASAELTKLLAESKLPEPTQKRLREKFAELVHTRIARMTIEIGEHVGNEDLAAELFAEEADIDADDRPQIEEHRRLPRGEAGQKFPKRFGGKKRIDRRRRRQRHRHFGFGFPRGNTV